jgi:hypothetical protein
LVATLAVGCHLLLPADDEFVVLGGAAGSGAMPTTSSSGGSGGGNDDGGGGSDCFEGGGGAPTAPDFDACGSEIRVDHQPFACPGCTPGCLGAGSWDDGCGGSFAGATCVAGDHAFEFDGDELFGSDGLRAMYFDANTCHMFGSALHACSDAGGWVAMVPSEDAFWYQGVTSPFLHQRRCGNFAVFTRVHLGTVSGDPVSEYANGAGLVVRQADGGASLLYSVAPFMNDSYLATTLWTDEACNGERVEGSVRATPGNSVSGRLLGCRVGDTVRFYRRMDGEESNPDLYDEATLSGDVDVGITTHNFSGAFPVGFFAYLRFFEIDSMEECLELMRCERDE